MMTYRHRCGEKKVSLLGYGAMRLPTVDGGHANGWAKDASSASIDQETLNAQVKWMLDQGVTYFDTSPAYCRGESERRLGEALAASGYSRESYVLATKLSNFAPAQYPLAVCKEMFENSLKFLRTDYIDNYLLHAIGNNGFDTFSKRYLENGALDWCCSLRADRRIRNLGFSYHGDRKAWDWCIEHHDTYKWDFCQIQMNYIDWRHATKMNARNLDAEYLYRTLADLKIPVVIMEPLLGGRLAGYDEAIAGELTALDPEATPASWALRFCGTYPNVMTVLSGMTRTEHIEENTRVFSPLKPLTQDELDALERAAVAYLASGQVNCTSCRYCMPCPYGLDIPALLAFRNAHLKKGSSADAKSVLKAYAACVSDPLRQAEHCTGCGICRTHCPQSIDIPGEIAAIDAAVDALKERVLK